MSGTTAQIKNEAMGSNGDISSLLSTSAPSRKRKKTDQGDDSKARRLRRSHEACTRCRSKKIKCDSQHPRCGSCAAAGAVCEQEDRHRNTFTPRGHVENVERQLSQCEALLRRFIPDFDMTKLDGYLSDGAPGIPPPSSTQLYTASSNFISNNVAQDANYPTRELNHASPTSPAGYYRSNNYFNTPINSRNPGPMITTPTSTEASYSASASTRHGSSQAYLPAPARPSSAQSVVSVKGQDPQGRDMSSTTSVVKGFGVSDLVTGDPLVAEMSADVGSSQADREDLAVGLSSGRELEHRKRAPGDPQNWIYRPLKRGTLPPPSVSVDPDQPVLYLPRDRKMANHIVDVYFQRLNYHRPVFEKPDFETRLANLYSLQAASSTTYFDDPGFLCSVYLILALGTLSELHLKEDHIPANGVTRLDPNWPTHEEFFEQALLIKPELRVTVSSLQALILLQWYLYCERHGRTLWRLVGNMVRLAVELGLHHNPHRQGQTFTKEECQLRIRLWWIVMIHDRGTAILLGRPIAIANEDFDTPEPTRNATCSEHFVHSKALIDVQADIINSLYRPGLQKVDHVIEHSRRILLEMSSFAKTLPPEYHPYFTGTVDWSETKRSSLFQALTFDIGLTFLKYGIARLLLLRAFFTNNDVDYSRRWKALDDAIKTSHNIIVVHGQLIKIPEISFFVSPLPLHMAAMTILFGFMSQSKLLPDNVAAADVHSALSGIPFHRWKWERKDANGGAHPILVALARKVFPRIPQIDQTVQYLLPEENWEQDINAVPKQEPPSQNSGLIPVMPTTLWFPGPAWTEKDTEWGMGSDEGTAPTSPAGVNAPTPAGMPASAIPPNPHPQTIGTGATNINMIPTQIPGAPPVMYAPHHMSGRSMVPDVRDFNKLLATLGPTLGGAAHQQPEKEQDQLYMQEEKDPVAHSSTHSRRYQDQFLNQARQLVWTTVPLRPGYPQTPSSQQGH